MIATRARPRHLCLGPHLAIRAFLSHTRKPGLRRGWTLRTFAAPVARPWASHEIRWCIQDLHPSLNDPRKGETAMNRAPPADVCAARGPAPLQTGRNPGLRLPGGLQDQPVFPSEAALAGLAGFDEPLPEEPCDPAAMLRQLHELGSPRHHGQHGGTLLRVRDRRRPAARGGREMAGGRLGPERRPLRHLAGGLQAGSRLRDLAHRAAGAARWLRGGLRGRDLHGHRRGARRRPPGTAAPTGLGRATPRVSSARRPSAW